MADLVTSPALSSPLCLSGPSRQTAQPGRKIACLHQTGLKPRGDEGKGKLVDILARRYDVVARCQNWCTSRHDCNMESPCRTISAWPCGRTCGADILSTSTPFVPVFHGSFSTRSAVRPPTSSFSSTRRGTSSACSGVSRTFIPRCCTATHSNYESAAETTSDSKSQVEKVLGSARDGENSNSADEELRSIQLRAGNNYDTAGAVLHVEALTLSAGGKDLIREGDWRLMHGEHAAVVGVNGAGKSTLLRAVVGAGEIQSGSIRIGQGTEVAYLEQTAVSGSTRTVWEEAGSRMIAYKSAMRDLAAAIKAVESAVKEEEVEIAVDRLGEAQERVEAVDGYKMDEVIASVLHGLGFEPVDWKRSCSEFSGGWQMRIALARLLLGQKGHLGKSLFLLDEPTNHLDTKAKNWLADYLKGVSAAVAIVSHDREFLESVCDRIVEIRGQSLHHYTGTYSKFLKARASQQQQALQDYQSKQAEIARLEGFVNRFGAKATKAAAANSKKKQIERIKQLMPDAVPASLDGLGKEGGDKSHVSVKLPKAPPCSKEVLTLKKANIGWDKSTPLLQNFDLCLTLGMRLVVLGPNGCGKSSLMKAMAGKGTLQGGTRMVGDRVEIGVFTQDLAQDLPGHLSGLEFVLQVARRKNSSITDGEARTALGALGLSGDAALRPISLLSGGEKARVALGVFMVQPYNCLLLDEPSNHLDRVSAQALAAGLSTFQGAMVTISHDEKFCNALKPTHIARIALDGSVTVKHAIFGNVEVVSPSSEHSVSNKTNASMNGSSPSRNKGGGTAAVKSSAYHDKKLSQQLQARLKKKLSDIEKFEAACESLDQEMVAAGSNASKAMEIFSKKEHVQKKLQLAESEWEQLERELQEVNARVSTG